MTRWVSGNNATAAALKSLAMVTLADLHFDSGTIFIHDGFQQLTVGAQLYSGIGDYGSIEMVGEDLSNIAQPITLTLSGVDPAYVADVMAEKCQGRLVTLYIGLLDVNSIAWYANPEILWEGRMDVPQIELGQGTATIRVTCEHRLMREPLVSRYTNQDQQLAHPTDNFFSLLWQIPLATASWGKEDVFHPAQTGPVTAGRNDGNKGGGAGGFSWYGAK